MPPTVTVVWAVLVTAPRVTVVVMTALPEATAVTTPSWETWATVSSLVSYVTVGEAAATTGCMETSMDWVRPTTMLKLEVAVMPVWSNRVSVEVSLS